MRTYQYDARRKRILEAFAETGSIKGTRRKTGHSIGTIRKVLRGKDERRPPVERSPRPSKLDPFKPLVQGLVLEDGLTALLAFEEIRGMGYTGGYSVVKDYVRRIRPTPRKRVTTQVDHPPGAEGQVDWSPYQVELNGERTQVHAFSFVLPFSRWMFVRFSQDEKLETLIEMHGAALHLLGGVPARISYDNMTTVGRHMGPDKVWINSGFAAFAEEYDFEVRLIRPGHPDDHGSVERGFHYVENNCLKRRRFRFDDLDELNRHAKWWCDEVANVRCHGTTRQRPSDMVRSERSFLKPLPGSRPEPFRLLARTIRPDHCVAVDTNRYSVSPRYVGLEATVRLYQDRLEILIEGAIHAVHARCTEQYQRLVLPEHEEEFKRCTPSRRLLQEAFRRLGSPAESYYEGLLAQRGQGAGYHMKRILRLADRHGVPAVAAAMTHAARFGNFSAEAVSRVLAGKAIRGATTLPGEVPMPPERVRQWLEGLHVEGRDLADYDDVIDQAEGTVHDDEE